MTREWSAVPGASSAENGDIASMDSAKDASWKIIEALLLNGIPGAPEPQGIMRSSALTNEEYAQVWRRYGAWHRTKGRDKNDATRRKRKAERQAHRQGRRRAAK